MKLISEPVSYDEIKTVIDQHKWVRPNDGHLLYQNRTMAQVNNVYEPFIELLRRRKFDAVWELGTAIGGFTRMLSHILKHTQPDTPLTTFDLTLRDIPNDIIFRKQDILATLPQLGQELEELGEVLLLCDNGDKIKEFNSLAPHLVRGSVIMAHDYAHNLTRAKELSMKTTPSWKWFEIWRDDIRHVCLVENIRSGVSVCEKGLLRFNNFEDYLWFAGEKES
jgi:hypothetical protein